MELNFVKTRLKFKFGVNLQSFSHELCLYITRFGGDRRVKKIVRELKWSGSGLSVIVLESENGNKGHCIRRE